MPRPLVVLGFLLLAVSTASAQQPVTPVAITIVTPDALDAEGTAKTRFLIENTSDADLAEVRLDMTVGNGAETIAVDGCPGAINFGMPRIGCTFPVLAAHEKKEAVVTAKYPGPGRYGITIFVFSLPLQGRSANAVATIYQGFRVTTTADGGAGSLRQAMSDVNAACASIPCKVTFAIDEPLPAEGWYTIALATPLSAVIASEIIIDAETQSARVFLDGRHVAWGDGLLLSSGRGVVRGLAIGGFPGNGILALQRTGATAAGWAIERSFLGVDPDGRAVPNGLRGLMGNASSILVRENVIRHNRHSGVFLTGASQIVGNTIEANGASGVFLSGTTIFNTSVVENNVIAGNAHFGVAVAPRAFVEVKRNTIARNAGGGIDVGLDGPTLEGGFFPLIGAPRITAARFDAATGDTVIEGVLANGGVFGPIAVYLYANATVDADGFAEGERFLGSAPAGGGAFVLRVHEDLRGLYVDGNAALFRDDFEGTFRATSEFGPPRRVE
jgi:Right handed beta helix region